MGCCKPGSTSIFSTAADFGVQTLKPKRKWSHRSRNFRKLRTSMHNATKALAWLTRLQRLTGIVPASYTACRMAVIFAGSILQGCVLNGILRRCCYSKCTCVTYSTKVMRWRNRPASFCTTGATIYQTWLRGLLQDEGIQLFGAPPSHATQERITTMSMTLVNSTQDGSCLHASCPHI